MPTNRFHGLDRPFRYFIHRHSSHLELPRRASTTSDLSVIQQARAPRSCRVAVALLGVLNSGDSRARLDCETISGSYQSSEPGSFICGKGSWTVRTLLPLSAPVRSYVVLPPFDSRLPIRSRSFSYKPLGSRLFHFVGHLSVQLVRCPPFCIRLVNQMPLYPTDCPGS
jgi:hypothetical protein